MPLSKNLFINAQQVIPGGVNSPVRSFSSVGGTPLFIRSAKGAYLYSEEEKEYIDYVGSWGPMILGHNHPKVITAIEEQCQKGISFGAPTTLETQLAEAIHNTMPSIALVRMVNSGTEATMSAIRLARGFTNRNKIVKFDGCYHGHHDSLLVNAGSGALTLGIPSSPGVPKQLAQETITIPYNNSEAVREVFKKHGSSIACIIVEPVAGNMNCILPQPSFLGTLREVCDQYDSILIFDEVMTGFRVCHGGAQQLYNITPDLTTLGKVIGGGLPVGAFGGRKDIMDYLAPTGPVYQAGTLSGNPLAMAAGLATLNQLTEPDFYQTLSNTTNQLLLGLTELANTYNVPFHTSQCGGLFGLFFTTMPQVNSLKDVKKCNLSHYNLFFHRMLDTGIYLAPSPFELGFVSIMHTDKEINKTLESAKFAFKEISKVT